ncbi:MAG: hypothetical protein FJ399_04380 [Verrucomicrobia bacterium]|nr:hypothetical protein [Verrucomicrobiota bacterium]
MARTGPAGRDTSRFAAPAPRPKVPENLAAFVAYAYSRKGQRVALKKQTIASIGEGPPPADNFKSQIEQWSRADVLLAVPRQLLLAAMPHRSATKVWSMLLDVCLTALRAHPASADLAAHLLSPSTDDECDSVLEQAATANLGHLLDSGTGKPFATAKANALRSNLVHTAVTWLVAARGWKPRLAIASLHRHAWRGGISVPETLRALAEVKDPAPLLAVASAFVEDAQQQRRFAEDAHAREGAALVRLEELEAHASELAAKLAEQRAAYGALTERLATEQREHQNTVSHLKDDYERLRSRILRRLTRELELLDEGMLALRRDPPKVHVMADHGDRAIAGLRDEIRALQSEDSP